MAGDVGEASARAHEVCFLCYLVIRIVASLALFIHIKTCFGQNQSKARVSQRLWSRSDGVGVSRSLRGGLRARDEESCPAHADRGHAPTAGSCQWVGTHLCKGDETPTKATGSLHTQPPRTASTGSLHAQPPRTPRTSPGWCPARVSPSRPAASNVFKKIL